MMHRGGYVGGHSERFERLGGKGEGPAAYRAEPANVIGPACRSATMPTHWRGPTFCGSTSAVTPRGGDAARTNDPADMAVRPEARPASRGNAQA